MTVVAGPWVPRLRDERELARVGETVFGKHSYAELADMMKVADYEHERFNTALAACVQWIHDDPRGYSDFSGRADAHLLKLPPLEDAAQKALDTANLQIAITPGTSLANMAIQDRDDGTNEYTDLLDWRKGLTDLQREWASNPHGCALPTYPDEPQPTAPDPQLETLQATQAATKPVDAAVDSAEAAAKAARDFAAQRTPWVVLGVALGVGLLIAARK